YHGRILDRIRHSTREVPKTLDHVIRECDGAFPTLVQSLLQKNCSSQVDISAFQCDASDDTFRKSSLSTLEGNPILCSWYFTSRACERIASLQDWSIDRLAFLGAPRLYEWFRDHSLGRSRQLLELDSCVLKCLSATSSDRPD